MGTILSFLPYTGHKTWREAVDIFSQNEKDRILSEIGTLVPPKQCQTINLIVIGNDGSGKSSLVNTFKTVLRNSGQLSTTTTTYGIETPSTTKKLFEITLKRFPQGEKLRIYDGRGLFRKPIQAEQTKPDEDDFIKTIEGHVKKGYKSKKTTIQEDDELYRRNPTISDKMHCVLFVINADHVLGGDHAALLRIQRHMRDMNIPIRLILTRVDNVCRPAELNSIFWNEKAYNKVEEAKKIFGFQDCQILPIANYVRGTTQNITQDVLALLALDNIVQEALSYIENEI